MGILTFSVIAQALLAAYILEPFAPYYSIDRDTFIQHYYWDPKKGFSPEPAHMGPLIVYSLGILACLLGGVVWIGCVMFMKPWWLRVLVVAVLIVLGQLVHNPQTGAMIWLLSTPIAIAYLIFTAHAKRPPLKGPYRFPRWFASFASGVIVGFLVMASIFSVSFHICWVKQRMESLGTWCIVQAGWGDTPFRITSEIQGRHNLTEQPGIGNRQIAVPSREDYHDYYRSYAPLVGLFVVNALLVLAASAVLLAWPPWFSPGAGLLILFHVFILAYVGISYFAPLPSLLVLVLALWVYACGLRPSKLRFRDLNNWYAKPIRLTDQYGKITAEDPLPPKLGEEPTFRDGTKLNGHFFDKEEWCQAPMAVVCVSGGGSNAAVWTMKVLTELERLIETRQDGHGVAFPHRIRLISGASGGMLAAACFAATVPPPSSDTSNRKDRATTRQELNDCVRVDFLSPTARGLFGRDLPALFHFLRQVPPFRLVDRGTALESVWSRLCDRCLDKTFESILGDEKEGWRPSLVFSPMLVEEGRQLLISNLGLSGVACNYAYVTSGECALVSRNALEFFRLIPEAVNLRLCTAARMSASFPYVMPAVEIPTDPPLRVVDAGYYDNYGVEVAAAWIYRHRAWIRRHASRLVLIQIRDALSRNQRLMLPEGVQRISGLNGFQEFTSPVEALLNFRSASTAFRNDYLLNLLSDAFDYPDRAEAGPTAGTIASTVMQQPSNSERTAAAVFMPYFATATFEMPAGERNALSLALTHEEYERIDEGIHQVVDELSRLADWWVR
jgi:hypothetical protein